MESGDILEKSETAEIEATEYRLYKKRWLILFFFYVYTISSMAQWIQYACIADVVIKYYQISSLAVNWSSLINLLVIIPIGIPGSYIIYKFGLRVSILTGIIGTAVGTWIKIGSLNPNRYWLFLLGQSIVALFQVLMFPVVPKLAAVWFGAKEMSLACSLLAMSFQVAIAIGFIIPPLIVKEGDLEMIKYGLQKMLYSYAAFVTILIPVLYIWFDDAPPTPPSKAQSHILRNNKISFRYIPSLTKILRRKSFVILCMVHGANIGSVLALSILLNEIVLSHYSDAYEDVGIIGLLMMCVGVFGMFITGVIITKFGRLRQIALAYYGLGLICTAAFLFLMDFGLPLVYFTSACLCFFNNSLINIGFELAVEFTYPEPEAISGGLLTIFPNIFTISILYTYTYLFYNISELAANLFIIVLLLITDLLLAFVKFSLKRHKMENNEEILNVKTYFFICYSYLLLPFFVILLQLS